jgi:hypothetical protein
MKIKEVTNPEEQLGLLRVIIDNTWSAIKQQADAHARQKAAQPATKPQVKAPKVPRAAPYSAMPKPLPKPKPQNLANPQVKAGPMATQAHKFSRKQMPVNAFTQNPVNKVITPSDALKTNKEKEELINPPYGTSPRKTA